MARLHTASMDPLDPKRTALLTDLYALTTAAACWEHGHNPVATFELTLRSLPPHRGFVVAMGLAQVLDYAQELTFHEDQVRFLRNLFVMHNVRKEFWEFLASFRFSGAILGAPEGTPVLPGEPILQVTAPLLEAQLMEAWIVSTIGHQSAVATQMARIAQAAGGRPVIEMSGRHAHGATAGVMAARAAYLAGSAGTTCLEAGQRLGIPVHPEMPHSFVLAWPGEDEAFRAFHAVYPDSTTLVLDTVDPLEAARHVVAGGFPCRSVRIDSGDLAAHSRAVRALLDEGGYKDVKIQVSGGLDETRIAELIASQAPIDVFVAEASLAIPKDAGCLDLSYDLVEVTENGRPVPRARRSPGREVTPGAKQAYRGFGTDGKARGDVIALSSERQLGAPILQKWVEGGERAAGRPGLETIRAYTQQAVASMPEATRAFTDPQPYPVKLSDGLQELAGAS